MNGLTFSRACFVLLGAAFAERVDAAMDIGVVAFVDPGDHVDHLPGTLRAGGVVEKHQRMSVEHVVIEDRKVVAERLGQESRLVNGFYGTHDLAHLRNWGMDCRLQYLPEQQTALLPIGRESRSVEFEHVRRGKLLDVVDGLAVHLFEQHRGRGLADDAAVAVEEDIDDLSIVIELQLDPHHVAAQRILVLVGVRRRGRASRDETGPRSDRGYGPGRVLLRRAWEDARCKVGMSVS